MFLFQGGETFDLSGIAAIVTAILASLTTIFVTFRQSKINGKISETQMLIDGLVKINDLNIKRLDDVEKRLDLKEQQAIEKDKHILECERTNSNLQGRVDTLENFSSNALNKILELLIKDKTNDC